MSGCSPFFEVFQKAFVTKELLGVYHSVASCIALFQQQPATRLLGQRHDQDDLFAGEQSYRHDPAQIGVAELT